MVNHKPSQNGGEAMTHKLSEEEKEKKENTPHGIHKEQKETGEIWVCDCGNIYIHQSNAQRHLEQEVEKTKPKQDPLEKIWKKEQHRREK